MWVYLQKHDKRKFSAEEMNAVCWSLFVDQSDEGMKKAWVVFDSEGKGEVDIESFREVLPLFGEVCDVRVCMWMLTRDADRTFQRSG